MLFQPGEAVVDLRDGGHDGLHRLRIGRRTSRFPVFHQDSNVHRSNKRNGADSMGRGQNYLYRRMLLPLMLFLEHRYSRVMVFVDYMNIRECIQHGGKDPELDLLRLTRILVGNRELMGAYVFDASKKYSTENDTMIREHDRLRMDGFRVISRESMEKMSDGRLVQKEVDVSLACEMLEHALMNHFDVAIVVSGDRDFVPAMQKVQAAGKRVEVASFKGSVNKECIKTADVYRQLDDIPFLMMRPAIDEGGDYIERRLGKVRGVRRVRVREAEEGRRALQGAGVRDQQGPGRKQPGRIHRREQHDLPQKRIRGRRQAGGDLALLSQQERQRDKVRQASGAGHPSHADADERRPPQVHRGLPVGEEQVGIRRGVQGAVHRRGVREDKGRGPEREPPDRRGPGKQDTRPRDPAGAEEVRPRVHALRGAGRDNSVLGSGETGRAPLVQDDVP
ncbi:MAG: NYN domain-containing protein [Candidatus Methanomethylophilaceae archaeon]|nr:NYN domain-containing protein [Candidatus Methanomethylophilaceae archaeon]